VLWVKRLEPSEAVGPFERFERTGSGPVHGELLPLGDGRSDDQSAGP
jgi:hypothetical protein